MQTSLMAVAIMAALAAGGVLAQDYPNKPIRIVTQLPGGGADFMGRLSGQKRVPLPPASSATWKCCERAGAIYSAPSVRRRPSSQSISGR